MQDHSTAVAMTAICADGLCSLRRCAGTVRSLSGDKPCCHPCHQPTQILALVQVVNRAVRGLPLLDEDPAPVLDEEELDDLLAEDADRRNDDLAVGRWS